MSVNPSGVFTSFVTINAANQFDTNRNGLERNEVAQAALAYRQSSDTTDQNTGAFLASVVAGGVDGSGFFGEIDTNKNNALSADELLRFAALDGTPDAFAASDFRAAAPARAVDGGVNIDNARLQQIANGTAQSQVPNQALPSQLLQLLSLILQVFTQSLGGNVANAAQPSSTAATPATATTSNTTPAAAQTTTPVATPAASSQGGGY